MHCRKMQRHVTLLAYIASCLLCQPKQCAAAAAAGGSSTEQQGQASNSISQDVVEWLTSQGAEVHFTVGRPCPTCERGALAAREFAEGDVIARIPKRCTVELLPGANSAGRALALLHRMHDAAEFNETFGPFVASLPGRGELLVPALYSRELVAELQTPALERLVNETVGAVEALYGASDATRRAQFSLGDLKYWTAMVATRSFSNLLGAPRLVPGVDMINHGTATHNTKYTDDGKEQLLLIAVRAIARGEELLTQYSKRTLHRPDAALMLYGYLPEEGGGGDNAAAEAGSASAAAPLLCAADLPWYNELNPFRVTSPTDDGATTAPCAAGTWLGTWLLRREHARLSALLSAMPTSEAEDEALLRPRAAGGLDDGDWERRLLVRLRLLRKKALRAVLAGLERQAVAAACAGVESGGDDSDGHAADGQTCIASSSYELSCPPAAGKLNLPVVARYAAAALRGAFERYLSLAMHRLSEWGISPQAAMIFVVGGGYLLLR